MLNVVPAEKSLDWDGLRAIRLDQRATDRREADFPTEPANGLVADLAAPHRTLGLDQDGDLRVENLPGSAPQSWRCDSAWWGFARLDPLQQGGQRASSILYRGTGRFAVEPVQPRRFGRAALRTPHSPLSVDVKDRGVKAVRKVTPWRRLKTDPPRGCRGERRGGVARRAMPERRSPRARHSAWAWRARSRSLRR